MGANQITNATMARTNNKISAELCELTLDMNEELLFKSCRYRNVFGVHCHFNLH